MESSAELIYLQDTLDKDNVFGFDNKVEQNEAVQWLIFWQANQGMQGNLNYFSRSAPEKIPCESGEHLTFWLSSTYLPPWYQSRLQKSVLTTVQNPVAIDRFRAKTLEIYTVLESRLSGRYTGVPRDFLAGKGKGKYSIADIGSWPVSNLSLCSISRAPGSLPAPFTRRTCC